MNDPSDILAYEGARVWCCNHHRCHRWFKVRQKGEGLLRVSLPAGWFDAWRVGYAAVACSENCFDDWFELRR